MRIPDLLTIFSVCLFVSGSFSCSGPGKPGNSQPVGSQATSQTPQESSVEFETRGPLNITLTGTEERSIGLQTEIAQLRVVTRELKALGKVLANQYRQAIVSYPFPARVSRILAHTGDYVRKGQPLIILQSEEVGEATAAFYKCSADKELARVCYDRQQLLFEKGVGARKDYLAAEAEFKIAEANLNAAEKKLHLLGFSEEEVRKIAETHQINPLITLYSPIEGKIVSGNLVLGSMVDETTEILAILDPSQLWVEAEIYEKDIARIELGQEAIITVQAYPDETFPGKITFISDFLNETSRTITIRTEVANRAGKLKPGMFASLQVSMGDKGHEVAVPSRSILDDRGQKLVFIKEGGEYTARRVQVGAKDQDYVFIIQGVSAGEEVVTTGTFQLKSKMQEEVLKSGLH
ncbi:MAG: efflux RND transporter periplasmic adaptor subunit [Bacteroidales bacterium]